MTNILLIDNDTRTRRSLARLLRAVGFDVEERITGMAGLTAALEEDYGLILLDLVLPDVAGEHVLRVLMSHKPHVRVLVLSGVSEMGRRVAALEGGAVDFAAKPFSNAELLARIHVRLRQEWNTTVPQVTTALELSDLQLNTRRRTAIADGKETVLSQREFLLANYLLGRIGDVCSRADIRREVWGLSFDPGTNVVDVCVRRLRVKLGERRIETVRNVGYRLAPNVKTPDMVSGQGRVAGGSFTLRLPQIPA